MGFGRRTQGTGLGLGASNWYHGVLIIRFICILAISLPLAGCDKIKSAAKHAGNVPDCGSGDSQQLVVKLLKSHPPQALIASAFPAAFDELRDLQAASHEEAEGQDQQCKAEFSDTMNAKLAELGRTAPRDWPVERDDWRINESQHCALNGADETVQNSCETAAKGAIESYQTCKSTPGPKAAAFIDAYKKYEQDRATSTASPTYRLENIRTKEKDTTTGRLVCQAVLRVKLPSPGGDATEEIAYQEEITSDKKLYVTLLDAQ